MTDAFDRMAQSRAEAERAPVPSVDLRRVVDDSLMYGIASLPGASPELRAFAVRVSAGECSWHDVETLARPVPPEIAELQRDPTLVWFPPRPALPPDDDEPYSIPWQ